MKAKVNGKPERIRPGSFPDMTVEQARKAAINARAQIHSGRNPNTEKKKLKNSISFGEIVELYLERYAKLQKKTWEEDQRRVYKFTKIWFSRKANQVTGQDIQILHEEIGTTSPYEANRLLSCLSAVFNKGKRVGYGYCKSLSQNQEAQREV